jgi:adenylyltransferase/sulfurtransferase
MRYEVQLGLAGWGENGQHRLFKKKVAIIGVGALGGTAAALLATAGVGNLRLIDHDWPSLTNLHRQLIYTEVDVKERIKKVNAAARYLGQANSQCQIEVMGEKFTSEKAEKFLKGVDLVLDGLDNLTSRRVLNRTCLELGLPWIHAGVSGYQGQLLWVFPGVSPCLECWFALEPENAKELEKKEPGIFGPLPCCLASLQASEALKFLIGQKGFCLKELLLVDLKNLSFRNLPFKAPAGSSCPVCGY